MLKNNSIIYLISDIVRFLISYEDFCDDLEKAADISQSRFGTSQRGRNTLSRSGTPGTIGGSRGRIQRTINRRDDYTEVDEPEPAFDSRNVERWYSRAASPKQRREFNSVYDSLKQFKDSNSIDVDPGNNWDHSRRIGTLAPRISVDDFTPRDDDYTSGPKPSDSVIKVGGLSAYSPARTRYQTGNSSESIRDMSPR